MKREKPAFTSVDIEALRAFNGSVCVGQPAIGIKYQKIEVYSPSGKLLKTLCNARAVVAEKGEHYTRDVYARNFLLV